MHRIFASILHATHGQSRAAAGTVHEPTCPFYVYRSTTDIEGSKSGQPTDNDAHIGLVGA
jgi:hypothetical protein